MFQKSIQTGIRSRQLVHGTKINDYYDISKIPCLNFSSDFALYCVFYENLIEGVEVENFVSRAVPN